MMGRSAGNDFTDEPTWREKFEDWRSNPLWVPGRPSWMAENLTTLALLFLGIAAVILCAVYLVVPPASLPEAMPGYFSVAKAEAAARKVPAAVATTTTTLSPSQKVAIREANRKRSDEELRQFWQWVTAVGDYNEKETAAQAILKAPAKPPTRQWALAFVLGSAAACLLVAAWSLSDTRGRNEWS